MRAIPDSLGTKFLDQTVPNCSELQRPDVVILHEEQRKAFLVDVTCPCETPARHLLIWLQTGRGIGQVHKCQGKARGEGVQNGTRRLRCGDAGNVGSKE